jgi:2-oxoglutarate dehydrogenase E2 component (dihydrolipoamide succinyltransferase)
VTETTNHSGDGQAPGTVLPWRVRRPRDTAAFLSPAVRRAAAALGVDPGSITGSGGNGRVTRDDVVQAMPAPNAERVAFNRVQQRSAAGLLASKQTSAHAYAVVLADYTAIDEVRTAHRAAWRSREGFSLTYLPFVARAVIDAVRDFPSLNATVVDDGLAESRDVNLGVAVDLAHQGLVVPVVRGADALRLRGVARAIDDLARRARAKKLTPDEVVGGTFTITNPGASGTWMSFPIINQPQVAILSTDGVAKRVVVDTDERGRDHLTIRTTGHLCLAFDERVVAVETAGGFLERVAHLVATRDWAAEL